MCSAPGTAWGPLASPGHTSCPGPPAPTFSAHPTPGSSYQPRCTLQGPRPAARCPAHTTAAFTLSGLVLLVVPWPPSEPPAQRSWGGFSLGMALGPSQKFSPSSCLTCQHSRPVLFGQTAIMVMPSLSVPHTPVIWWPLRTWVWTKVWSLTLKKYFRVYGGLGHRPFAFVSTGHLRVELDKQFRRERGAGRLSGTPGGGDVSCVSPWVWCER